MDDALHEAATHHLPIFVTAPGQTDWLMSLMAIVLVGSVLGIGVFFFWLHSLPERMVHNKVQFDLVAVLALLSLFTHIHAFWVAALIIALIDFPKFSFPDFSSSLQRIAGSLEMMSGAETLTQKPQTSSHETSSAVPTGLPAADVRADSLSEAAGSKSSELKRRGARHA